MKILLLPFAWLYGIITQLRNLMYKKGVFKSYKSSLKTICIGNIQVGGTGKTPLTAFIYQWLSQFHSTAILSRGYGRTTKGLLVADDKSSAKTIGDEPFWYFSKLKCTNVVVSESRTNGLKKLETICTKNGVVLLDDAFQHQAVTCDHNIVLTPYFKPYYNDHMLPFGRLREYKSNINRAHTILVTKCPIDLSLQEKIDFIQQINPFEYQMVFFTTIHYQKPRLFNSEKEIEIEFNKYKIKPLCSIANPFTFIKQCEKYGKINHPVVFKDHHNFSENEIIQCIQQLNENEIIITTEKDEVKILEHLSNQKISFEKLFVLPMQVQFLFNEENEFKKHIYEKLFK